MAGEAMDAAEGMMDEAEQQVDDLVEQGKDMADEVMQEAEGMTEEELKEMAREKLGVGEYEKQGPVRLGTAFINTSRCLPWANQIPCVVCEEVCPVAPKAIQTLDEETKDVFGAMVVLNKPFIVPDLCIGCGICQAECPVQDRPAVYVTAVGESRSRDRKLLLRSRTPAKPI